MSELNSVIKEKLEEILFGNLKEWKNQIQAFSDMSIDLRGLKSFFVSELQRMNVEVLQFIQFYMRKQNYSNTLPYISLNLQNLAFLKTVDEFLSNSNKPLPKISKITLKSQGVENHEDSLIYSCLEEPCIEEK